VILIKSSLITSFTLLFLFTAITAAEDYIEDLLYPKDRMERAPEVPIGYDFDNVIFGREYFYSLTEGIIQFRNSNSGPWKSLDLNLGVVKPSDQTLKEVPAVDSWENDVAPRTVEAPAAAPSNDVRQQITKPKNMENKKQKEREDVLRDLQRSVEEGR
jgi:hypothetical protein